MEIFFAIVGGLTAYFNYRRGKADGSLARELEERKAAEARFVQKPLEPGATRREKLAHWLGLYEI